MAQEFIRAAEEILREHGEPLLVKDIYHLALVGQLLKSAGKTPVNTLRARLSEHIRFEKDASLFKRIGPNKFALREWDKFKEYQAHPIVKNKSKEIVVCIGQDLVDKHGRFFGFSTRFQPYLKDLENPANRLLINRGEAKSRHDIKQLVSYVLIRDTEGKILSFVRGSYGQKESLLLGVLCIGFGGHVNNNDIDLFTKDAGVSNSARREIYEEIKGLKIENLACVGVINDDSSPLGLNHFAFVYEAKLPKGFPIENIQKEKAISKVRLLESYEVWEKFHEMEFWSQLLMKKFIPKPSNYTPVFVKDKTKRHYGAPLAIVGEVGCGKSEAAKFMANRYSMPIVSTRQCVAKLIREKDFGVGDRQKFQMKSLKFISKPDGIKKLAEKIIKEVQRYKTPNVIIDGIRNVETYNHLKNELPDLNLMYIDVPRDTALGLFTNRSRYRDVSINEFRNARDHQVEKEIILFKTRADIYLFNGGTLGDLTKTIKKWWDEEK